MAPRGAPQKASATQPLPAHTYMQTDDCISNSDVHVDAYITSRPNNDISDSNAEPSVSKGMQTFRRAALLAREVGAMHAPRTRLFHA